MINIETWMDHFKQEVLGYFKERILFIGIQGSYARHEATKDSDIDVVVIFDRLQLEDLMQYDALISRMPERAKICGFVSGKDELMNWEKSDLFQFYYDTKPVYGDINDILPLIKKENVQQAILIGSCNIYHACCHNMVHEKSLETVKALYKQAAFVLQAKHFYETDHYIAKKADLVEQLNPKDRRILNLYFNLTAMDSSVQADKATLLPYTSELLAWSSRLIKQYHI